MEEKSKLARARIQKETAYKIVIKNYAYLVGHIDAIRIFPHLVTSRLVEQDFRQRLDCKQTDKAKMMALLLELTRSTEETWFDGFTNALSKVPQYEKVANSLMKDFAETLAERMANPTEEDASKDAPVLLHDDGAPVVNVTVSGVNEVMKKAMEDAQVAMKETIKDAKEAMKEAKRDHSKALFELKKANDRVLEAEKGKVCAEAEKRLLETKVQEVGRKLSAAEDKMMKAEVHKQLLEKEAQSYKYDLDEARHIMEMENMRLSANNSELYLQLQIVREKVQKVEGEMTTLETRVASLLAEIESGRREREGKEEEGDLAYFECQLSDGKGQEQPAVEKMYTVTNLF